MTETFREFISAKYTFFIDLSTVWLRNSFYFKYVRFMVLKRMGVKISDCDLFGFWTTRLYRRFGTTWWHHLQTTLLWRKRQQAGVAEYIYIYTGLLNTFVISKWQEYEYKQYSLTVWYLSCFVQFLQANLRYYVKADHDRSFHVILNSLSTNHPIGRKLIFYTSVEKSKMRWLCLYKALRSL